MARWKLSIVLVVVVAACSDPHPQHDDAGAPDGGSDAAPDAAPDASEPASPEPPSPPLFTPCPDGWREVDDGNGVVTCDPWPEGGVHDCDPYEAHFPGEPDCAAIGTPCPEGDFPEGLPDDGTIRYVLAGAADGDGSMKHPFGTVGEATTNAPPGTTIAVGKGTYVEEVVLGTGITLRGACVAETVIRSASGSERDGVIQVDGSDTGIENLRIGHSARRGVSCHGAGNGTHISGCLLEETSDFAIATSLGCTIGGETIVVRRSASRDPMLGRPLDVDSGSIVEFHRVVFEDNQGGVGVSGLQTSLRLEDAAIRDTSPVGVDGGRGVNVQQGATFAAIHTAVERCTDVALHVLSPGTTVTLEDVLIRDTRSDLDGTAGSAIEVYWGAEVHATRLLAEGNHFGIFSAGSTGVFDDLVVRDPAPDASPFVGVYLAEGSSVQIARSRIEQSTTAGIVLDDSDSRIILEDVAVHDTESRQPDGTGGSGLYVAGEAELTRALFERNRELSMFAFGALASIEGRDVIVRDTLPSVCATDSCADDPAGTAVGAYEGASIDLTNLVIERSDLCGLQIASGSSVDLHSGVVADNAIGACVQVDDYALDRLTDAVVYQDNGSDIERTDLPVPGSPFL